MPVFEGLLPEPHNSAIQRLLFTCAHWHGLAKLRMHTDQTLEILDDVTVQIGADFRAFKNKICPAFNTRELRRETNARKRRNLKKTKGKKASTDPAPGSSSDPTENPAEEPDEPLSRSFNLQTYKYHSLGDVANTIRIFGTSDSFSTEPVGDFDYLRTTSAEVAYLGRTRAPYIKISVQAHRQETICQATGSNRATGSPYSSYPSQAFWGKAIAKGGSGHYTS